MLRMTGVSKEFPGVRALSDVDFEVLPGEIHALLGENGAGKSTLIKVLTGVYRADAGEVTLDGQPVHITSPTQAREAGISTVYQEVNLCPNLSVAENIFIGSPVRWKRMRGEAQDPVAALRIKPRRASAAGRVPAGHPATGGDRASDAGEGQGPHPRRADLQP